ncbi:MAG: HD domain-containing protein [Verrucomicrobiota bacterium]
METLTLRALKEQVGSQAEAFAVRVQLEQKKQKTTRSGSPFFELRWCDAEDFLPQRIFESDPHFASLPDWSEGEAFEISGEWSRHETYGIEVRQWKPRRLRPSETEALFSGSAERSAFLAQEWQAVRDLVDSLQDPRLRSLGQVFCEQFGDRFRRTAAARTFHHARRGGLLEHVAQMMRAADALTTAYPKLNRDLLLAGVLFHDCGKIWENPVPQDGFAIGHSETGEMLGHITIGIELVNKLWNGLLEAPASQNWLTLDPPSEDVRRHLLHLVASHHGEHQFGAPVVPKTPEAMALHYIDNLDAKMEMFRRAYQEGAPLTPKIHDRVYPLPGNSVVPLPSFLVAAKPAPEREAPSPDPDETPAEPHFFENEEELPL